MLCETSTALVALFCESAHYNANDFALSLSLSPFRRHCNKYMQWVFAASCCFNPLLVLCEQHSSSPPRMITRVQVTLNGDIYNVDDVTTVEMLQKRLWEESGYTKDEQGSVMYQGQVLTSPNMALSDVGVQDGDQINMVPQSMARHWTVTNEMNNGLRRLQNKLLNGNHDQYQLQQNREQLRVLRRLYNDITNRIPFIQDEMDEFAFRVRYPVSLEYATNDVDRIENLRQIIINNPILLSYIMCRRRTSSSNYQKNSSIAHIIQDKKKWKQLVQNSVGQWKHLSGYQVWQLLVKGNLLDPVEDDDDEEEETEAEEGPEDEEETSNPSGRYNGYHQDGDYEEEEDGDEYYEEEEEED